MGGVPVSRSITVPRKRAARIVQLLAQAMYVTFSDKWRLFLSAIWRTVQPARGSFDRTDNGLSCRSANSSCESYR